MATEEKEFADEGTSEKAETADVPTVKVTGEEIPYDKEFSYDGYQVVRGEFFAHINEPTITFNGTKISVNMACIKRLPEVEHIQILINESKRNLVVRPSSEDEKESFIWCTRGAKRSPKQVTGKEFMAKLLAFTGWNPDNRYKLLGKIFRTGNEVLFIFNLDSKLMFPRTKTEDGKIKTARTPVYSIAWEKPFGPTFEEHRIQMESRVFKGYTVISVVDKKKDNPPTTEVATIGTEPQGKKGDI